MGVVRLYVDQPLGEGQSVPLTRDQAHYLFGVMRLAKGNEISVFNGADGEFLASVESNSKKAGTLICLTRTMKMRRPPDLWLLFAPLKKARTDFIVEKATELGAARILPVRTDFTNAERIRRDRLQAHAIEAAEQCGATFVPEVAEMQTLETVLAQWPNGRRLVFCDEATARGVSNASDKLPAPPAAILIGPEGGFSETERSLLKALPEAVTISLGPRILRADTAVVAALSLWQAAAGDWR